MQQTPKSPQALNVWKTHRQGDAIMPIKVSEEQWPSIGAPVTIKKVDKVWGPSKGGRVSVNENLSGNSMPVSDVKRGKPPSSPHGELGPVAHNNATISASGADAQPTPASPAPPVKEKMVFGSIDPNTVFRCSPSTSGPTTKLQSLPTSPSTGASEVSSQSKKSKSRNKKNKNKNKEDDKRHDEMSHADSSTPIVASSSRITFSIGVEAEPVVRRHRLQSQTRVTSRPTENGLTPPSASSESQRWKFGTASRSRNNSPPPQPPSAPETSPDDAASSDQHIYPYPQASTTSASTSSSSSSSTIFDPRASAFVSCTSSSSTTPPQPLPPPLPSYPVSHPSLPAPFGSSTSRAYANGHPDPDLEVKDYGHARGYPILVPGPQQPEVIPPPHQPTPSGPIDEFNGMYSGGRGRRGGGGRGYRNGGESRPRRGRRGMDGGYRGFGGNPRGGGQRPPTGPPPFTVVPPPPTRLPLPLPVPLPLIPHMAHPGASGPPVPAPLSTVPFPLDPTRYWLLGQLEYYMSPQNMAQDFFLKQQMDARGWIPISLIASFNRVKTLIPPPADEEAQQRLVREVLMLSTLVQVRGGMVRMGGWERYVLPDANPSEVDESAPESMYGGGYPLPLPPYGYPGYQHGYMPSPGGEGYWDGQHHYQQQQQQHVYHPENGFFDSHKSSGLPLPVDVRMPRVDGEEEGHKEGADGSTPVASGVSIKANTDGVSVPKSPVLVNRHDQSPESKGDSILEAVREQSKDESIVESVVEGANDAGEDNLEEEESDEEDVVFVMGSENHVSWSSPASNNSQRRSTKT